METTKITSRNFYEALCTLATEGQLTFVNTEDEIVEITAEELKAWAEKNIAQLDKRNETARARTEKKKAEGDALTELVYEALTNEFATIADIAACVDTDEEVSIAKVQYRVAQLAKTGRAEKGSITIPGSEGVKSRVLVAYRRCGDVE